MRRSSILTLLNERLAAAVSTLPGVDVSSLGALVRAAGDPRFGDYQCNVAMSLARTLAGKPREIAERIAAAVDVSDLAEPLEIAGPGFINIRLRTGFLETHLADIPAPPGPEQAERVGIPAIDKPIRVVVDYSSPNIAKQMHVGHIRSTIIGDVFARVLGFEGHTVIRQNHVGDWGTAIGMVILGLWYIYARLRRGEDAETVRTRLKTLAAAVKEPPEQRRALLDPICAEWAEDLRKPDPDAADIERRISLADLELGYIFVQTLASAATRSGATIVAPNGAALLLEEIPREVTRMLQEGGSRNDWENRMWRMTCEISLRHCQELYTRLRVLLTAEDVRGESFYHDRLAAIAADLRARIGKPAGDGPLRAVVREDAGALCIFLENAAGEPAFRNPDGEPLPIIVQKSDGAYLYATTDLAAIRYRIDVLHAGRIIYVTDARQKLHFEMFFAAARALGWVPADVALEHVTFGSILGENRKPLKTREGENVKLGELLDEAERRAYELLAERERVDPAGTGEADDDPRPTLSEAEKREIARRIGVAAVRYADLSRDRNTDYVFSWDKMLAFQGNTAPYMLYAYARIRSIYRKAAARFGSPDVYASSVRLLLREPAERALAMRITRLHEAIDAVAADLMPHVLCAYLYDLASDFMRFYESCPVLSADDDAVRLSRMRLSDLAARSLRLGLELLGIEVLDRM